MVGVGWFVLSLVFVDELLAIAAFAVWGWDQDAGWLWVWLLPSAAMAAWLLFASPKARYGGRLRRPLVKAIVFGLACVALWDTGHQTWAVALLAFSVVVNGLAQIPAIAALPRSA